MNRIVSAAAVSALLVAVAPQTALAQNGHGGGNGHGQGQGQGQNHGAQNQGPQAHGPQEKGGGRQDRGPADHGRGDGPGRAPDPQRADRGPDRAAPGMNPGRDVARGPDHVDRGGVAAREVIRSIEGPRADPRDAVLFRDVRDHGLIAGCPPGLAKKDNGCLPPGQARQIARDYDRYDRYSYLWNVRADDYAYRYRDGYLYRLSPRGSVLGYLPVLGGALWTGSTWPSQYAYEPVPAYYSRYYGLRDANAWRYADGVVYGVDPQTQAITQVAALLTGQNWTVGQRMPAGYDVYNVPYAYRGQYVDSPQAMYRYSDGYVYRVDPQTQLIQTVIQLLT